MDCITPLPEFNGAMPRICDIPLTDIAVDGGTQPRGDINQDTVEDYAESLRGGTELPPAVVFFDGTFYWLADGFHRREAHVKAGSDTMRCDVRTGTRRDAVLYSVGANATHGLPRTSADKRRAVVTLLTDAEWCRWSNRQIASACAVSESFARGVRADHTDVTAHRTQRTFTNRYGHTAKMETANIGRKPSPAPPEPDELDNSGCSDFTPEETPGVPWAGFVAEVKAAVEVLQLAKKQLSDVLGFDPRKDSFTNPYAHFASPLNTVKALDTITGNILGDMPAEPANASPGFLTVKQVQIRGGARKVGGR